MTMKLMLRGTKTDRTKKRIPGPPFGLFKVFVFLGGILFFGYAFVVGFTGETGGKMKELSDYLFNVPSKDTPRIQESHMMIGHIICELVEEELFGPL